MCFPSPPTAKNRGLKIGQRFRNQNRLCEPYFRFVKTRENLSESGAECSVSNREIGFLQGGSSAESVVVTTVSHKKEFHGLY